MQLFATLVGANFRPVEARNIVKDLTLDDGRNLTLEPEPDNQYDANAVRVLYSDDTHLGYIARASNPPIFDALSEGKDIAIEIVAFESNLKPVLQLTFDE